ncbi:hypothetical protein LXL04_026455 [Taraxacum kok-saghyz]
MRLDVEETERVLFANYLYHHEEEKGGAVMMMMLAEGRTCESKSHGFKGPCVSDNNCSLACKQEGFSGGHCRVITQCNDLLLIVASDANAYIDGGG